MAEDMLLSRIVKGAILKNEELTKNIWVLGKCFSRSCIFVILFTLEFIDRECALFM